MKKFMQANAIAKELAARKGDRDSMLMGLNYGGGSDDADADEAESLAYGHMRIRKDGTVMTDADIRELRQRQGYCLTCPGDPIKLFAVKRSKMNPLYQKKEPIQSSNQSSNGVCLKCGQSGQQNVRRGSIGVTSSGGLDVNRDMRPGTVHSLHASPAFKQMRRSSTSESNGSGENYGTPSSSTTSSTSFMSISVNGVGNANGGPDLNVKHTPMALQEPPRSPMNSAMKRRVLSSKFVRSNSGEIVKRSLTPTRLDHPGTHERHILRRSNSDESLVSTGITPNMLAMSLPQSSLQRSKSAQRSKSVQRSKSDDCDAPVSIDVGIAHDRSTRSNNESESVPTFFRDRASERGETNLAESKASPWKDIADIVMKSKKREGDTSGSTEIGAKCLTRASVLDSNGFIDVGCDASHSEFQNSFANLSLTTDDDRTSKDPLAMPKRSDTYLGVEGNELPLVSSTETKTAEIEGVDSQDATSLSNECSSTPDQVSSEKPSNQQLSKTSANDMSAIESDLLHTTLLTFMKASERRFDALERQMLTILEQQALILQQNGAILHNLSDRKPATPLGSTIGPCLRREVENAGTVEHSPGLELPTPDVVSDQLRHTEHSPTKKLKDKNKSKFPDPSAKVKGTHSPEASVEKATVRVEPTSDNFATQLERNSAALVDAVTTPPTPTPAGPHGDYEMKIRPDGDSKIVAKAVVEDAKVIKPRLRKSMSRSRSRSSSRNMLQSATTTATATESRRSTSISRMRSTRDAPASDAVTDNSGTELTVKTGRRQSSRSRIVSEEPRAGDRTASLDRPRTRDQAGSTDDDCRMTPLDTPRTRDRADSTYDDDDAQIILHGTVGTPTTDTEPVPQSFGIKSRRRSTRRPEVVDGEDTSSSRRDMGSSDVNKQERRKERKKLKKRSSTTRRVDEHCSTEDDEDDDDDNNS